jgi:hypothetical protein
MSEVRFGQLYVERRFDRDGTLSIEIQEDDRNETRYVSVWLPREEVIRLRDHLNKVLGVAQ